jgi:nucleoside-diphosphate-sugar epimerase
MGLVVTSDIMNILLTGANGFLGRIIKNHLSENDLTTLGRISGDMKIDLSNSVPLFTKYFDLVIHAAGQAHLVPKNKADVKLFYNHNVEATANLLLGLEKVELPKYFVYISSVSVYGLESGLEISEESPLLAKDPYGKSKIDAEMLVKNWCDSNNISCTILRLPLIAGPNPPGNLGFMLKGLKKGYYFNIASGLSRKSIVLASDIAKFIIPAAEKGGTYNLTDGEHPSFKALSQYMAGELGKSFVPNIPYFVAYTMAKMGDLIGRKALFDSNKFKKIISSLTFSDKKARSSFGWNPTPVLKAFKLD